MRAERQWTAYGRKVKKRLIDMGMTQADLAAELGVSRQYICRILSGDRSGLKYLADIEKILKLQD